MREIPLTQGKVALVDDEDFELVSRYKWWLHRVKCTAYAITGRTGRANKQVFMHRLILGAATGQQCDHRNSNGLDNRRSNLRACTHQQNQQNRRKQRQRSGKPCSSRFKGVCWQKEHRCWRVHITHNGNVMHLGYFHSEHDAARAYDAKATELFGEFALLNFGGLGG